MRDRHEVLDRLLDLSSWSAPIADDDFNKLSVLLPELPSAEPKPSSGSVTAGGAFQNLMAQIETQVIAEMHSAYTIEQATFLRRLHREAVRQREPALQKPAVDVGEHWYATSPPQGDGEDWFGPIVGGVGKFVVWLKSADVRCSRKSLHKNNCGGTWYVQRIHAREYKMWLSSQSLFAKVNAAKLTDAN